MSINDYPELKARYRLLQRHLNERTRRIFAAAEARALGRGGVTAVARVTGLSRTTIYHGLKELDRGNDRSSDTTGEYRLRNCGGGRKTLTDTRPSLITDLDSLLEPIADSVDPVVPLRWTCKSTSELVRELQALGHHISRRSVYNLLEDQGYALSGSTKGEGKGTVNVDRDTQFRQIADTITEFQKQNLPVISVEAVSTKSENSDHGPMLAHKLATTIVNSQYSYPQSSHGGPYDIANTMGGAQVQKEVAISREVVELTVASIRHWWLKIGKCVCPKTQELLIIVRSGLIHPDYLELWKFGLRTLTSETGMVLQVCHLPKGRSKWAKTAHQMLFQAVHIWRAAVPTTLGVLINLLDNPKADYEGWIQNVLITRAREDKPTDRWTKSDMVEVSPETPNLGSHRWNYRVKPKSVC